jgi:glycerol kinase
LAARAAGVWRDDDELTRRVATAQRYLPRLGADAREARLAAFGQAVGCLTRDD